jgi:hypothetical protein
MILHDCDNDVCKLLNPCIDELLPYKDVIDRVAKVEEFFHCNIRKIKNMERLVIPDTLDIVDWANKHMVYQLPNKEFVYKLANKIKDIKPDIIIEVGAGRGIISKHMSKILNKEIILTDSYDWWYYRKDEIKISCPNVLKRSYIDAIEEFKPDLIIVSWIPYNECWTREFRKYPFVKGYIIIGEHKGGATGSYDDWNTDWKFQYLDDVEKYGICKTDVGFLMIDSMYRLRHTSVAYFERP